MKCGVSREPRPPRTSHPARGAWIEIMCAASIFYPLITSHPARGAWIEIMCAASIFYPLITSHPARGAWIEITVTEDSETGGLVAPRTGCVD